MLIEFIGPTGAGKSTLMREVYGHLNQLGNVSTSFELVATPLRLGGVSNRMGRNIIQEIAVLPIFIGSLNKNKSVVSFVLRMLWRQPKISISTINNIRAIERKIGVFEKIQRYSENSVILVDEGTLHLAHKIFVFSNAIYTPDEISRFARLIPVPDLVIYVRAPLEILVNRTLRRPDPPREIRKNISLAENYIKKACEVFEIITQDIRIENRVLIVENPGNSGGGNEEIVYNISKHILDLKSK